MAEKPVAEIRKLQQLKSEELQALRQQEMKNYEKPGIGGLWRNAWRAGGAALMGFGAKTGTGLLGKMVGATFLQKPWIKNTVGVAVAAYSFFSSMTDYKNDIRQEAASRINHIDIILESRAQQQGGQQTLERLSQDDLAAYRSAQQSKGKAMGEHTQNAMQPRTAGVGQNV